jgi:nucleoside-diphosphate-sugar epimerase
MRERNPPRRILLTGATGPIGRALLPALASTGAAVRVLVRDQGAPGVPAGVDDVRWGDLERPSTLGGIASDCDVVVHAAVAPRFRPADRDRVRRVQVSGTEALLREAESAGSTAFILVGYTGTIQERDDIALAVDEETPPEPAFSSAAVRTVYEAEAAVLEANGVGGLHTMVVSAGALLAPGLPTLFGGLVAAFVNRELPYRMLDDAWLAVSDGPDLGRCTLAAMRRGQGGHRYFATSDCVRLGELYDRLARVANVAPPRRRIPDLLVEELGLLTPVLPEGSFLRQVVLPRELVLHLQRLAPLFNRHAREALEFTPTPLDEVLGAAARYERALAGDAAGIAG